MTHPNAREELELAKRFKIEVKDEIKNPPELHDVEHALWRSFWDLSTERQAGFDRQGRILWSAIQRYAKMQSIEPHLFERIIRAMDDAYLRFHDDAKAGKDKKFTRDMLKKG